MRCVTYIQVFSLVFQLTVQWLWGEFAAATQIQQAVIYAAKP
jgi:hypothetical protein